MHPLGSWIAFFLLLMHHLRGVNQDALNSPVKTIILSSNDFEYERERTLKFPHEILPDETNLFTGDSLQIISLTRRVRSVFNSSGILCSPVDSCASRCGEPVNLSYTCNCDKFCSFFSDCCIDYENRCLQNNNTQLNTQFADIPRTSCEVLYRKYSLLVVSQCPQNYGNILNRKHCMTKVPKVCDFSYDTNVTNGDDIYTKCKEIVYRSCKGKLQVKCNEEVEPQCISIIKNKCSKQALSVCEKCYTNYWPVYDQNGIIFKNSFCAICNSQENYTVLSPYSLNENLKKDNEPEESLGSFMRRCVPNAIDICPDQQKQSKMQDLCKKYLSPVSPRYTRIIYRNVYCALCNGEKIEDLECATEDILMRSLIRPVLENFLIGDGQGMNLDDIPAAFSILLNFGLDGRERMFFSSEQEKEMRQHQQRCGKHKIWDPFSEICRKLYCSTEFILVDYHCIKKETQEEEISKHEIPLLPDTEAEFVHLTLNVEMELLDFLIFNGQDFEAISETVRKSLAHSFNINIDRIRNVTFNVSFGEFANFNETLQFLEEMDDFHPITFYIDFDLYEDQNLTVPEPSVDSIVSMLASSLSMNGFELDIHNVSSRIFEIHQTVSLLTSWCNSSGIKEKIEYWNSEFSLITSEDNPTLSNNQIKGIYVNKTGKFYPRGQFVADILFQGYQFSGNLINVSGVAIVCDFKKTLNESCPRILIKMHEYTLENGSLIIHNENIPNVDTSAFEKAENGSLWVCVFLKASSKNDICEPDEVMERVSYILLWISVAAMLVVLLTYIAFGSLRNLPGCNTMNLTFSVTIMQITFLFGQRDRVTGIACKIVAHLLHYEILCCFMWMNVMAFDLYKTFGNKNILSNIRSKRKYLPRYMAYAYLSPVVIILTTSLLDIFAPESRFAPNYGLGNGCWITKQYSAVLFFAVPLAAIMCLNFLLFLLTVLAMRSVKNLLNLENQKSQRGRNDVFLYAKMALVIGLTWSVSFAAAYTDECILFGKILRDLFIVLNTLQGVFIFWVFVCNRRIYELYKKAFVNLFQKILNHVKYEGNLATISRFSNVMTRTKSNDTVVSTLSNISTSSGDSNLSIIPE